MSEKFKFKMKVRNTRPNESIEDELSEAGLSDVIVNTLDPYSITLTALRTADSLKHAVDSVKKQLGTVLGEITVLELEYPSDQEHHVSSEVVVTKNTFGQIVAVTRQNEEGEIQEIISESSNVPTKELTDAIQSLDLALSFSLCNREHERTRRDIKKAQGELERVKSLLNIESEKG